MNQVFFLNGLWHLTLKTIFHVIQMSPIEELNRKEPKVKIFIYSVMSLQYI